MTVVDVATRPIIFSGEMVRAILGGRKTQTRRVMKPQPRVGGAPVACVVCGQQKAVLGRSMHMEWSGCDHDCSGYRTDPQPDSLHPGESLGDFGYPRGWEGPCPYGKPGDRLWVREKAKKRAVGTGWFDLHYAADDDLIEYRDRDSCAPYRHTSWTPSIHMPRWASRITLEVTDVRVERLQEIVGQPGDLRAEGIEKQLTWSSGEWWRALRDLWDRINAKRGYGWDTNPWVWVLTFRRCHDAD